MSFPLRREILKSFKELHKTRLRVFEGDPKALTMGRQRINDEYKKNKNLTDESKITELLELAKAVEVELRTTVIQAREVRPGVFAAKFREETTRLDNVPFNDCATVKSSKKELKKNCG